MVLIPQLKQTKPTHLGLIPQQAKWYRVGDGEGQKAEVEGRVVKLEVDARVGAGGSIGEALAKQGQASTLPVIGGGRQNRRSSCQLGAIQTWV